MGRNRLTRGKSAALIPGCFISVPYFLPFSSWTILGHSF